MNLMLPVKDARLTALETESPYLSTRRAADSPTIHCKLELETTLSRGWVAHGLFISFWHHFSKCLSSLSPTVVQMSSGTRDRLRVVQGDGCFIDLLLRVSWYVQREKHSPPPHPLGINST